ncbi:rhomboid family intramembrane serine protease [Candidatus Bathyarchaeota archaeon]|nr:rhomboid family intramembrane serine protease [Candidatus Bathyarchaeota archaeon]
MTPYLVIMGERRTGKQPVTSAVITLCVLVFVVAILGSEELTLDLLYTYGLVPARVFERGLLNLVSYQFIHVNLTHLVSNMFVLYGVGREVERNIGSPRFALVYLASGVAAGFLHAVFNPFSTVPVIGASGAVFGIIAVLLLLMPFKITTALVLPLPGVVMGLLLLVVEVTAILVSSDVGIAHDIHLYGFLVGGLGAFAIDYNKALRGLVIAAVILLALYLWALHLGSLPLPV